MRRSPRRATNECARRGRRSPRRRTRSRSGSAPDRAAPPDRGACGWSSAWSWRWSSWPSSSSRAWGLTLVAPALRRSSTSNAYVAQLSREALHVRADATQDAIDRDLNAASLEVPGERRDVARQQIVRGRMGDDIDGLREVDEDRALTPPQDVERREVAVDAVDRNEHRKLVEQLVPHPLRDRRSEVDLRETRCRTLVVADERHQVAVVQQLDRWWNGHAGFVETYQAVP